MIADLYAMDKEKLAILLQSKKSTAIELHIAAIIANGIKKGCAHALESLLIRSVGRIKDSDAEGTGDRVFRLAYDINDEDFEEDEG